MLLICNFYLQTMIRQFMPSKSKSDLDAETFICSNGIENMLSYWLKTYQGHGIQVAWLIVFIHIAP